MKKIKVAVIGLGYWGPNLVRNFIKIPDVEIIMGCDLLEKNLNSFSQTFPYIATTKNFDDILIEESISVVAIATPLSSHFKLAKQSLLSGKHVIIEKPMTRNTMEAKELQIIAKKKNRLIMVGHTFVYSEAVRRIKKIIDSDELGKIFYYDSTRINLGLLQQDSNVIWDLASHDLAILNYLFQQKPISVQAFGSSFLNKKNEELAHVFIRYPKNIMAHIYVSWLSPVKIRTILIGGEKKMITYDDIEPTEKIRVYDKNITLSPSQITPFSPAYRSGDIYIPQIKIQEALLSELLHFIDCVRNNKKPLTGWFEGNMVVKLLELVDYSLLTKKEVLVNEK